MPSLPRAPPRHIPHRHIRGVRISETHAPPHHSAIRASPTAARAPRRGAPPPPPPRDGRGRGIRSLRRHERAWLRQVASGGCRILVTPYDAAQRSHAGYIPEEKRHSQKAERAKSASSGCRAHLRPQPGMPTLRSGIPGYYKSASSGCHSLAGEVRLSETHVSAPIRPLPRAPPRHIPHRHIRGVRISETHAPPHHSAIRASPTAARAPRRGAPPPPPPRDGRGRGIRSLRRHERAWLRQVASGGCRILVTPYDAAQRSHAGYIPEEKRHSKKAERAKSASCRMPSAFAPQPGMPSLRSVIPGYYKSASSGCHPCPVLHPGIYPTAT